MCFSDTRRELLLVSEKQIGLPSGVRKAHRTLSGVRRAHRAPFWCQKSTQSPGLVSAPASLKIANSSSLLAFQRATVD